MFSFCPVIGKLNVSIQHTCNKKRLPDNRKNKNKKNYSSMNEEAEMRKQEENLPESTSTSVRPETIMTFGDATCKKNDSENEFDDEMLADGKLYK